MREHGGWVGWMRKWGLRDHPSGLLRKCGCFFMGAFGTAYNPPAPGGELGGLLNVGDPPAFMKAEGIGWEGPASWGLLNWTWRTFPTDFPSTIHRHTQQAKINAARKWPLFMQVRFWSQHTTAMPQC
eukprot:1663165-Rhodomonas_salina.1